ncbi:hypothetical protein [Streptomyces sp. NPDC057748]|uniref:hypothetical protein n=1 Tax=unclassified Streptomyces TaxID=2593676 RepID=UPI003699C91C
MSRSDLLRLFPRRDHAVQRHSLVLVVLRLCRSVDGVVDAVGRFDHEQDGLSDSVRPDTRQQKKVPAHRRPREFFTDRNSPVRGRPS